MIVWCSYDCLSRRGRTALVCKKRNAPAVPFSNREWRRVGLSLVSGLGWQRCALCAFLDVDHRNFVLVSLGISFITDILVVRYLFLLVVLRSIIITGNQTFHGNSYLSCAFLIMCEVKTTSERHVGRLRMTLKWFQVHIFVDRGCIVSTWSVFFVLYLVCTIGFSQQQTNEFRVEGIMRTCFANLKLPMAVLVIYASNTGNHLFD